MFLVNSLSSSFGKRSWCDFCLQRPFQQDNLFPGSFSTSQTPLIQFPPLDTIKPLTAYSMKLQIRDFSTVCFEFHVYINTARSELIEEERERRSRDMQRKMQWVKAYWMCKQTQSWTGGSLSSSGAEQNRERRKKRRDVEEERTQRGCW